MVTNGPMTIDVHGPTLEEALVTALGKAGVFVSGSYDWAKALQTLMESGEQEAEDRPSFYYPNGEPVEPNYAKDFGA
jgi:hypothetical protein